METAKHQIAPENATLIKGWLATRGGVAIWKSINLSNPGGSWLTPALDQKGEPYDCPTWQAANEPDRIITDITDIEVVVPKEVKRFHIGVRVGSQGLSLKVTDGGSRRIRAAVAKAGDDAWYELDRSTQEAVILVPDRVVPLADWQEGEAAHA